MRGTKAKAIRRAQAACQHEIDPTIMRAPGTDKSHSQFRYNRCRKCGLRHLSLAKLRTKN